MCISFSLSATVALVLLFAPKVYIILFQVLSLLLVAIRVHPLAAFAAAEECPELLCHNEGHPLSLWRLQRLQHGQQCLQRRRVNSTPPPLDWDWDSTEDWDCRTPSVGGGAKGGSSRYSSLGAESDSGVAGKGSGKSGASRNLFRESVHVPARPLPAPKEPPKDAVPAQLTLAPSKGRRRGCRRRRRVGRASRWATSPPRMQGPALEGSGAGRSGATTQS